jgi:hypothetical protein
MYFDNETIPETIKLECGATAHFDHGSGYGYRCEECMAVVGSIAQPKRCVDLDKMVIVVEKLKGTK